ncbi:MAG: glycan-binding surface protein [Alistipes sp.]
MKTKLLGFIITLLSLTLIACDDDSTWLVPTTSEPMQISRIVDPKNSDAVITTASLEQLIKIEGTNLNNVKTIYVNDVEAVKAKDMIPVNGAIFVRVPYTVPLVIDNKIKLTDKADRTVEAPLTVTVPDLVVEKMICEHTPTGATLTITGNYFDLYGMTPTAGKVLFGSIETAIATANKSSVSVIVPANVPANTTLKLKSAVTTATCPGLYKDSEFMMETFDGKSWDDSNKIAYITGPTDPDSHTEATDPVGISGKYMRYHNTYVGGWAWQGFNWPALKKPADLATNAAAYALKFEAYAVKPLADPIFMIIPINGGQTNYRWGGDAAFKTGSWQTYTIPLAEAADINKWISDTQAAFVFHADGTKKESYWCIDNVRISKIK